MVGREDAAGVGEQRERTVCVTLVEHGDGTLEAKRVYYKETDEDITDHVVRVKPHPEGKPNVYSPSLLLLADVGHGIRKVVQQRRDSMCVVEPPSGYDAEANGAALGVRYA